MRYVILAASVAALAVAAPAAAQKGGPGGERGGGKPTKVERGGGNGGGKSVRAERRGGGEVRQRSSQQQARAERVRSPERQARAERKHASERRDARPDRTRLVERKRDVGTARNQRQLRLERERNREVDHVRQGRHEDRRDRTGYRLASADRGSGLINSCPPGLAAKNNGCLPPGRAKKLIGRTVPTVFAGSLLPAAYRDYYPDTDDYYYRSGDGLIYRVARSTGLVDGYSPLWGYGADYTPDYYYAGERYPLDYVSFYNVPAPYQGYYQDNDDWLYRYGDGGIYQVNRSTGLVETIVALLAGDLGVGQRLPAGYDVYNVPYAYRDRYQDTPDRWFRYNDGYIYQVDPQTRLIQAVIQALV